MSNQQDSAVDHVIRLYREGMLGHAMLFTSSSLIVWERAIHTILNVIQPCETIVIRNEDDDRKHPIITIKQIQQLQQQLSRKSMPGRLRIILIPCAEELTSESGNALLKILEEPPVDTLFILRAFSRMRVLSTIVSRCTILKLSEGKNPIVDSTINLKQFMSFSLSEKMIRFNSATKNDIQELLGELEVDVLRNTAFHTQQGVMLYQELLGAYGSTTRLRDQSMYDALCVRTSI